ncbi:Hypothetical protein PHPALM_14062 [Phytophthora palmivora]|uniref:DDE Tnp4 domain-containing protein n=1 Tax=Phytophthora palmivora TaxID=4796 RepID=A0A2P4XVP9_9STRA|nr:Hypothetical protein PHPALM_14062 [Phytophthora palmivora]
MIEAAAQFQFLSNHGVIENCIGVIDDWLCPIRVPRNDECGRVTSFFQATSMNDSYAFQRWQLSYLLHNSADKYFAIGDNAFVQSKDVLTPFNKAQLVNPADRDSYNFHFSQLRIRIEMEFGLLVNKWRVLKLPPHVRLRHCRFVISACIRLYNFCITQRALVLQTSSHKVFRALAREVCSWNKQDSLGYEESEVLDCDGTEVELDNGSRVDLMDEKVRTDLVNKIASRNFHRPERNVLRRQKKR